MCQVFFCGVRLDWSYLILRRTERETGKLSSHHVSFVDPVDEAPDVPVALDAVLWVHARAPVTAVEIFRHDVVKETLAPGP